MFTHVFMNLGIFMLPDPVKGAEQIYRTPKPGGIALVTTPRSTWWLSPFQKAQKRIKPDAEEFQGMLAPEWAEPEKVKALLEQAGFSAESIDVREAAADVGTANFTNSQEMVRDMIVKGWSDDETARFDKVLLEEFEVEANSGVPRQMGI
jgi:SAM-dependent methyltransferase